MSAPSVDSLPPELKESIERASSELAKAVKPFDPSLAKEVEKALAKYSSALHDGIVYNLCGMLRRAIRLGEKDTLA